MVEKRLRKHDGLCEQIVPPRRIGDAEPDTLLVCWGSTFGPASEAAALLCESGTNTGILHFPQVWPMVPDQVLPHLESARHVVCVEGNATGQLARLIRRETGFAIPSHVRRYDGLPVTPAYILDKLDREG
jgi:2-oxoglutarate ferredoxin oxidoreductase subunit alpha